MTARAVVAAGVRLALCCLVVAVLLYVVVPIAAHDAAVVRSYWRAHPLTR